MPQPLAYRTRPACNQYAQVVGCGSSAQPLGRYLSHIVAANVIDIYIL